MNEPVDFEWIGVRTRHEATVMLMCGDEEVTRVSGMALSEIDPVLSTLTELSSTLALLRDCRAAVSAACPKLVERIDSALEALSIDRPFSKEEFREEFRSRTGIDFFESHDKEDVYGWLSMGDTAAEAVSDYIAKYGLDDLA